MQTKRRLAGIRTLQPLCSSPRRQEDETARSSKRKKKRAFIEGDDVVNTYASGGCPILQAHGCQLGFLLLMKDHNETLSLCAGVVCSKKDRAWPKVEMLTDEELAGRSIQVGRLILRACITLWAPDQVSHIFWPCFMQGDTHLHAEWMPSDAPARIVHWGTCWWQAMLHFDQDFSVW